MNSKLRTQCHRAGKAAMAFALAGAAAGAFAVPPKVGGTPLPDPTADTVAKQQEAAMRHVTDAVTVVQQLNSDPRMKSALQRARGAFIVPTYGRAALGLGASGGTGMLLVRREGGAWSDPAFYNIGSLSVGLQAGAEGGPIAMVLNNEKAVAKFMQNNPFSLSADAGLTIVNWAAEARGGVGDGDVLAWSGARGLFGNAATVAVNGIAYSQRLNDAYYRRSITVSEALSGKYSNAHAQGLKLALEDVSR